MVDGFGLIPGVVRVVVVGFGAGLGSLEPQKLNLEVVVAALAPPLPTFDAFNDEPGADGDLDDDEVVVGRLMVCLWFCFGNRSTPWP